MSDLAIRLTPSDVFDALWNDASDLDRVFERLSLGIASAVGPRAGPLAGRGAFPPLTDVEDKGTVYSIRTDLPGIPKEKIDVRVNGSVVIIRAESTEENDGPAYLYRERSLRSFERSIELPEPVVAADVKAEYKDGVLSLEVPKAHPATEQKVTVA